LNSNGAADRRWTADLAARAGHQLEVVVEHAGLPLDEDRAVLSYTDQCPRVAI
jgi:hypothetical protein